MVVPDQMSAGEQGRDFLARKPVAVFDCRFAGHRMQQLIEQVIGIGWRLLARSFSTKFFDQAMQQIDRIKMSQHGRISGQSTVSPPKGSISTPNRANIWRFSRTAAASFAARSTGSGTNNRWISKVSALHFFSQLLVENPFMQCMLVDNLQSFIRFSHQITVVYL